MIDWLLQLPTWQITRAAGLLAYYLLFAGILLGILHGTPAVRAGWKNRLYRWHTRTQGAGMIVTLAHVMILVIDHYSPFSWLQLLVPFSYPEHRLGYGLGSLAFYGLLLVLLTSDFRLLIAKKIWYSLHLLAYPVFVLALLHGVMDGTDTRLSAIQAGYWATAAALIVATLYRGTAESRKWSAANRS